MRFRESERPRSSAHQVCVHNHGDAAALVYKNDTLSYQRLWGSVAGASGGLSRLSTSPRDCVVIYLEKRVESLVAMFAATAAGLVFVPVNPLIAPSPGWASLA